MKATPLQTENPEIRLVEPDIKRDAPIGVGWLAGDLGRDTLRLMGVSAADNKPSSLQQERRRLQDFITNEEQLNWMIKYQGGIVGAAWVNLATSNQLPGPSVHIMIGDQACRGKGVGTAAITAVVGYLRRQGNRRVYSRHLIENTGSKKLLNKLGFQNLGRPYTDGYGLDFQNVSLDNSNDD